jgi:hypothetical protein
MGFIKWKKFGEREYIQWKHKKDLPSAIDTKRDIYSIFSRKWIIPEDMSIGEIKKKSSVIARIEKNPDKGFDIFISSKPNSYPYPHPIWMQRKKGWFK